MPLSVTFSVTDADCTTLPDGMALTSHLISAHLFWPSSSTPSEASVAFDPKFAAGSPCLIIVSRVPAYPAVGATTSWNAVTAAGAMAGAPLRARTLSVSAIDVNTTSASSITTNRYRVFMLRLW